jgi:hypothetical protein
MKKTSGKLLKRKVLCPSCLRIKTTRGKTTFQCCKQEWDIEKHLWKNADDPRGAPQDKQLTTQEIEEIGKRVAAEVENSITKIKNILYDRKTGGIVIEK